MSKMDTEAIQQRHPGMDANEATVWAEGMEHLEEKQGEPSKAEVIHERMASETATLEDFHGETQKVYRIPLKRLLQFIRDWSQLQARDGESPDPDALNQSAEELADEAAHLAAKLNAEPDSGFTVEFFRGSDFGLELAVDLIMSAADKFGADQEDAEKFRS